MLFVSEGADMDSPAINLPDLPDEPLNRIGSYREIKKVFRSIQ